MPETKKRREPVGKRTTYGLPLTPAVQNTKDAILILIGISCAVIGLECFIIPNQLIDGGAMGISLLIANLTDLPLSLFVILINLPFFFLGYRDMGKRFVFKTMGAIALLAFALAAVDLPVITTDRFLTPIFGGAFLGAGIGFTIRGGAVIDGTEILAINLSKRLSAKVGDFILLINILVFAAAAVLIGMDVAMYSVLAYFSASKMVDFITTGIEEYTNVTVVSSKSEEIRLALTEELGRGATIFCGKRGFGKHGHIERDIDIIVCIITRLEISSVKNLINEIDPDAFLYTFSVNETVGGMVKQRSLH